MAGRKSRAAAIRLRTPYLPLVLLSHRLGVFRRCCDIKPSFVGKGLVLAKRLLVHVLLGSSLGARVGRESGRLTCKVVADVYPLLLGEQAQFARGSVKLFLGRSTRLKMLTLRPYRRALISGGKFLDEAVARRSHTKAGSGQFSTATAAERVERIENENVSTAAQGDKTLQRLLPREDFSRRHIGPNAKEQARMLQYLGFEVRLWIGCVHGLGSGLRFLAELGANVRSNRA